MEARLRGMRWQTGIKAGAMVGLAVAAPVLVVGTGAGLALAAPACLAALGASYYKHTRLVYEAQLTAEERLALGGKHDIANRIHLEHQEYRTLKTLKEQKRLLYPYGSNGIPVLRDVLKGLGAVRRWFHGPLNYDPAHETVMTFLRAQASHDTDYLRDQQTVVAYEAEKAQAADNPADVSRRQEELEAGLLEVAVGRSLEYQQSLGSLGDPMPEAEQVLLHFLGFVAQHRLEPRFLHAAQHDSIRKLFQEHDLFARDDARMWVDLPALAELIQPGRSSLSEEERQALVQAVADFSERFLLVSEKQRATYSRNELMDFLMMREWGNSFLPAVEHDDSPLLPTQAAVAAA